MDWTLTELSQGAERVTRCEPYRGGFWPHAPTSTASQACPSSPSLLSLVTPVTGDRSPKGQAHVPILLLLLSRPVVSTVRPPLGGSPPGSSLCRIFRQEHWSRVSLPSPPCLSRPPEILLRPLVISTD